MVYTDSISEEAKLSIDSRRSTIMGNMMMGGKSRMTYKNFDVNTELHKVIVISIACSDKMRERESIFTEIQDNLVYALDYIN